MATLEEELKSGVLSKVDPKEPIFVIRAQDQFGPATIRTWAGMVAYAQPTVPTKEERDAFDAKYAEAMKVAEAMTQWPNRKIPD